MTYTDFTPISLLISEYIAYTVRADSPIRSIAELIATLKLNYFSNNYLGSADTRKYLDQQYGEVKQILTEIGLARPASGK